MKALVLGILLLFLPGGIAKAAPGPDALTFQMMEFPTASFKLEEVILKADQWQGFEKLNLKERGLVVRDDPQASTLYYRFVDSPASLKVSA